MKVNTHTTKTRSTDKKVLKFVKSSAMILYRKVAGLVVQGLKNFWNNWQWAFALGALLYGIFLFYYQSTTSTPARLDACEKHIAEHITASEERFKIIEYNQHKIDITLSKLETMMATANADLAIIKSWIVEKRQ